MAKFIFKLQSILNLRQQMEDSAKNELAKARKKLEREKRILKGLEDNEYNSMKEIANRSVRGIRVDEIKKMNLYLSSLRIQIGIQKENVNCARGNVDKVREELVKRVQEREMLDKLKERKYEEYFIELSRQEQKLNDEIVSFKYGEENMTGEQ